MKTEDRVEVIRFGGRRRRGTGNYGLMGMKFLFEVMKIFRK